MWRDEPITEKQTALVKKFEKQFTVVFQGKTKGDASDFIYQCIKRSREESREFTDEYYHYNYENPN